MVCELLYTQRIPTRLATDHGLLCGLASHHLLVWAHTPFSGLRTPAVTEKTPGTFPDLPRIRRLWAEDSASDSFYGLRMPVA